MKQKAAANGARRKTAALRHSPPGLVVVKLGTSSITGTDGAPDKGRLRNIVDQIALLNSQGIKTVIVSSGAIAAGLQALSLSKRPTDMPTLQAAAAVGQSRLMDLYADLFKLKGLTVGQVLLTQYDIVQRRHYLNARHTMDRLLELGCVPIVNENDTVAVEEIRYGDNDRLAALVANIVRADILVMLSDVEGLYSYDPNSAKAKANISSGITSNALKDGKGPKGPAGPRTETDMPVVVEAVDEITPEMMKSAKGASLLGSGGMASKLEAARMATFSGVAVVVASATRKDVLLDVSAGLPVGTYFHPSKSRIAARKLWIALAPASRGRIVVDEGAVGALAHGKKSLLAAGVMGVEGNFTAGDAVEVAGLDGKVIAKGLVSFDSNVVDEIAGTKGGREVIHRDQLVVL